MTDDTSTGYLVDRARCVCLCGDGLAGYTAAIAIESDGTEHAVLAAEIAIGDDRVRYDATCAAVAHEQLGPLPPRWFARVRLAPLRCGRPTKTGTPCRVEIAVPGRTCGWHRNTTPERNHS